MKTHNDIKPGGLCVAMTGGIACGKSEVARIFREHHIDVLDADSVAHRLLRKGSPMMDAVVERFGADVLNGEGHVDRRRLGERIFASDAERLALNAIMHPVILTELREWSHSLREQGRDSVSVIPLLYEIGKEHEWDVVICVTASSDCMMQRLLQRGLSRDEADQRIRAQMPVEEKMMRADYVIDNNDDIAVLTQRALKIWNTISGEKET